MRLQLHTLYSVHSGIHNVILPRPTNTFAKVPCLYLYNFETLGSKKSLLLRILLLRQLSRKKKENRILNVFFRKKMGGGESGLSLYNVHSLGNSRAIFHSGLNNKFLSPEKTHVRPFLLKWTGGKEDSFSRIVLLLHPLESDRNKPHSEYFWGREVFLGRHPDPHSSFYLAKKRPLLLLPRPRA